MSKLERALVRLGDELSFPATPDISERVLARLTEPPPRRRRALVLVLAVLAVAIGAAMAVPQARTAILELFRLRGATVERVDTLPSVPARSAEALRLGREAAPAELEDALVPAALGHPEAAYVSEEPYGSRLTLVYGSAAGVPESPYTGVAILIGEFAGEGAVRFVEKMVGPETEVEVLQVGPYPALWIEGGRHAVLFDGETQVFEDRGRLAGNTLLVERNGVLVRIEGEISRERAIEIAESLE